MVYPRKVVQIHYSLKRTGRYNPQWRIQFANIPSNGRKDEEYEFGSQWL